MLPRLMAIFQPSDRDVPRCATVSHKIQRGRHLAARIGEANHHIIRQSPAMRLKDTPEHVSARATTRETDRRRPDKEERISHSPWPSRSYWESNISFPIRIRHWTDRARSSAWSSAPMQSPWSKIEAAQKMRWTTSFCASVMPRCVPVKPKITAPPSKTRPTNPQARRTDRRGRRGWRRSRQEVGIAGRSRAEDAVAVSGGVGGVGGRVVLVSPPQTQLMRPRHADPLDRAP